MATSQARTPEGCEDNIIVPTNRTVIKAKKASFNLLTHPKLIALPWQKFFRHKNLQLQRETNESCPILNLPPEITIEIFLAIFPWNSFSSWGSTTPLLFGAVCHSWRVVAWSYPLLWSSVSLIVQHYTETKNDVLREWLARSGDFPLSIQFHMREPPSKGGWSDKIKMIVGPTMDIIACCSDRWQNIEFRIFAMYYHKLYFISTQLPLLTSMSISTYEQRVWNEWGNFPKIIWNAPMLQHVHLSPGLEKYLVLPPNQIETFSWLGPSPSSYYQCLKILEDNRNLTKCQFACKYQDFHVEPLPQVTALTLKTLNLAFWPYYKNSFQVETMFNNLTIPALLELSIDFPTGSGKALFPYVAFTSFIFRSECHLMSLSLSNLFLSEDLLAECLLAVPSLTDLRLEKFAITSETLRNLSVGQLSQKTLLTHLKSFTYIHGGHSWDNLDYKALSLMAESRWDCNARISSRLAQLNSIHVELGKIDAIFNGKNFYSHEERDEVSDGVNKGVTLEIDLRVDGRTATTFRRLIVEGMDIQIIDCSRPLAKAIHIY